MRDVVGDQLPRRLAAQLGLQAGIDNVGAVGVTPRAQVLDRPVWRGRRGVGGLPGGEWRERWRRGRGWVG